MPGVLVNPTIEADKRASVDGEIDHIGGPMNQNNDYLKVSCDGLHQTGARSNLSTCQSGFGGTES